MKTPNLLARSAVASLAAASFLFAGVFSAAPAPAPGAGRGFNNRSGALDSPEYYQKSTEPITTPSIVKGQPAGIEVGQCPPDFELQPIQPYADFEKWLGADAPKTFEDKVNLSKFVGKAPILLLFGSYT
ncbi:MAG: hypothetical protein NTW86_07870 [Candidatus Sumerlaeota bacterium]|nr:hypothetical protein [Candidatus Sumerlaeota bacterium]